MCEQATTIATRTVTVPGATLYVEIRGSGPVLLCIPGGPTDAGMFNDLAERLGDRYTSPTTPAGTRAACLTATRRTFRCPSTPTTPRR